MVMHVQYFRNVDEVYSNFEQSETGVFLNIAGTTVPLLEAYFWGDQYTPDTPGT